MPPITLPSGLVLPRGAVPQAIGRLVYDVPLSGGVPGPTFDPILIAGDSNTSTTPSVNDNSWAWQWMATRPETIENRAQGSRSVGTAANLNDNGNTLFGNVAENLAYGPDLVTYMIGSNDWSVTGGTTDAQYRTNLTDLFNAYKAAAPAVKIAWSPPPPYNPTGTPHAAKAWFDAQRASLMADARNPAVWGQWADYYTPLGEHPDFADPATAAPLFGDSVHYSAAGDDLVEAVAAAAFGTILDPTRQNSNTLYDAAWLTDETNLVVGETITRRMIVSGLKWTGHDGGVSVTGAGSPSVKVGGVAGPAAYAYNGDVIDLTLTLSGSYETTTSVDLTIGGETRTLSFTTAANVAPVVATHIYEGNAVDGTTLDHTVNFPAAGRYLVFANTQGEPTASVYDPAGANLALTKITHSLGGGTSGIRVYVLDVPTLGAKTVRQTFSAFQAQSVLSIFLIENASVTLAGFTPNPAGAAPANVDNPHETTALTVPANGLFIGALAYSEATTVTPATVADVNPGTDLADNCVFENAGQQDRRGLIAGTRGAGSNVKLSFDYKFGSFGRAGVVFAAG